MESKLLPYSSAFQVYTTPKQTASRQSIGSSLFPNMNNAQQLLDSALAMMSPHSEGTNTPSSPESPTTPDSSVENVSLSSESVSKSEAVTNLTLAQIISQTANSAISISNTVNRVSSLTPQKPTREARIKRPMNAFMVWSQQRRQQISATGQKFHNSDISKMLGAEWRKMDESDKIPFVDRAKQLREEHFRDHPDYVYRPRRRKRVGKSTGSVDSVSTDETSGSPTIAYNAYSNVFAQLIVQQFLRNSVLGNATPSSPTSVGQNEQLLTTN